MARRKRLPPVKTGLRGRCPACGEGSLFKGVLSFHDQCAACDLNFADEDAGDGPAVFVIFILGIFVIPLALGFWAVTQAPLWLVMLIWTPIMFAVGIYSLRKLRGVMFNVAWVNKAREVRNSDVSKP